MLFKICFSLGFFFLPLVSLSAPVHMISYLFRIFYMVQLSLTDINNFGKQLRYLQNISQMFYASVYTHIPAYMCVCVCVRKRETDRERERVCVFMMWPLAPRTHRDHLALPPKSWDDHTQLRFHPVYSFWLDWTFRRQTTVTSVFSDPVNSRDNHSDITDRAEVWLWYEYVNWVLHCLAANLAHCTVGSEVPMCSSHVMSQELCSSSHSSVCAFSFSFPASSVFFHLLCQGFFGTCIIHYILFEDFPIGYLIICTLILL